MAETFTAAQAAKFVQDQTWHVYKRQKWTYKFSAYTLVRYIECAPMREEIAKTLIEYLTSPDCSQTLTLEHKPLSGEWTPVTAWYDQDEQHPDRQTGLPRVRLYHAVRIGPSSDDDGPYVVENGCAWKVEFTFHWKTPNAPSSLPQSSSGENYRYTSVTRDDEGLWSYILEKRTRVQQDIAEYVRRDDALELVKATQHIGVKEGQTLDEYKAMAGVAQDGTVTEVDVTKNEDCTSNVAIVKRKRKNARASQTCTKDIFRHEHTTVDVATSAPAGTDVDAPANGVVQMRRVELRQDNLHDVTTETTTELGVEDAESSVEQDLFSKVEETEDRSQVAVADEPAAEGGVDGKIVRKSVVKTPGNLRNKRKRTVTERAVSDSEKTVTQDLFSTVTETEDRNQDAIADEPSAEGGADGIVVRKSVVKTPGGKRNKKRVETQERAVLAAEKTVTETAFETVVETLDRNQQQAAADNNLNPGTQLRNRKTPGARFDTTTRTTTEKQNVKALSQKKKDLYGQDTLETTRVVDSDDSTSDISDGGTRGKTVSAEYRKTESGKFVKELRTHTESKVLAAKTLNTGDANSTTVETQTYADDSAPTVVAFAQGVVRIYRSEKTPGGKFVVVESTETATAAAHETMTWNDSSGSYVLDLYWNQASLPTVSGAVYAGRRTVQPHFTRNKFGLFDGSILVHNQPATSSWKGTHRQWWPNDFQKTGLTRKFVTMVRYDDQWYKRVKTVTYTYGYDDDLEHGSSVTNNKGLEEFVSGGLEGSKVVPYGPGAYYYKVTKIEIKDTAVTSPVDTSENA